MKERKLSYTSVVTLLACALLLVIVINLYTVYTIKQVVTEKTTAIQEAAKPAVLDILLITNSKCADCYDAGAVIEEIAKTPGIKIEKKKTVEFSEADNEVAKFGLLKFPTIIVTGETSRAIALKNKLSKLNGKEYDNSFVFSPMPPYTDKNGDVRGKVDITLINDESCKACIDLSPVIGQLRALGVFVKTERVLSAASDEGKKAIALYKVKRLPGLILSPDFGIYDQLAMVWRTYGTVAGDGSYVMTEIRPPYKDVATGDVKGLVTLTYLSDKTCLRCYNVSVHKQILEGFGLAFKAEKEIDIASAEGALLGQKYNITAVPTILMSPEVKEYSGFDQIWLRVGTVEKDETYIFRAMEAMTGSTYRDVSTGQLKTIANE